MTRNTAREIAAHLAYEWNFTDLPVGEFLDRRLAPECFAELAPECGLYADAPNAKQAQYIRRLVAGVADHAAELDDYIARYAQGWRFERIPLMASAVMRVAMYEILYMPDIPHGVAISQAVQIAGKYESAEVVKFINGILASFLREEVKDGHITGRAGALALPALYSAEGGSDGRPDLYRIRGQRLHQKCHRRHPSALRHLHPGGAVQL